MENKRPRVVPVRDGKQGFRRGRRRFTFSPLYFKHKGSHQTERVSRSIRERSHPADLRREEDHPYITDYRHEEPSSHTERVSRSSREHLHPADLGRREDHPYIMDYRHREPSSHTGNQLNLEERVLNLIVTDLHTPSLVEEEGFQLFLKATRTGAALVTSWVQTELLKMYDGTRTKVQTALRDANDLALSAEIWTASEASYLTVTCHFIDKGWDLKSYVLETAHLLGEHTPDNVHRHLWRILTDWEIRNKVHVVVVNMESMHKVVPKPPWMYLQCFGYALNKVFKEVMDNPDWRALLKKCRHVVEILHRETQMSWTRRLTQSPALDWLPTLSMVEKILKNWTEISRVFIDKQVQNVWLNENERKMLCDAKEALMVLQNATSGLGKSGYAPVSNIIPLLDELRFGLQELAQSENQVALKLAKTCQRHFGTIKQIRSFTVSTALDPRFKTCVLMDDPKLAEDVKKKIKQELGAHYDGEMILQSYVEDRDMSPTHNPLGFWIRKNRAMFKELVPVAHKYLSIVSTAVPLERVVQQDRSQIINRRRCLAPEDLNVMLFLNGNHNKT